MKKNLLERIKELEAREELWMEYAGLLALESSELWGFAYNHGLRATAESVADGIRLREALGVTPEEIKEFRDRKREERA